MKYYPLLYDIEGKCALVVGGGEVAQRKVETLLEFGARVYLVTKDLREGLKALIESDSVGYLGSRFEEGHLDGMSLVIAATNDKALNRRVSECARNRGLLVNAVDQPEDCNFIVPSIVKRGDLLVAISTSGKSPALSKKLRKELEGQFGNEYALFLALMGRLRVRVLSCGFPQRENARIFKEIVQSSIIDALAVPDLERVHSILSGILPEEVSLEGVLADLPASEGSK